MLYIFVIAYWIVGCIIVFKLWWQKYGMAMLSPFMCIAALFFSILWPLELVEYYSNKKKNKL